MHSSSLVVNPTWIMTRDSMCLSSGKGVALAPLDNPANGLLNQDIGFTHSDRPSYRAYLSRHTIQSTALPAPVGPIGPLVQDLALWLNIVIYRLSAAFSRRTSEVNEILIKGRFLLSIFLIHIFLGMASSSDSSSAPRLSPPPLFAVQQPTADQQLDQLLTSQENPNQSYHRSSPTAPPQVRRETSRGNQDDSGGKPPATDPRDSRVV